MSIPVEFLEPKKAEQKASEEKEAVDRKVCVC
jgi:hypothetical protein